MFLNSLKLPINCLFNATRATCLRRTLFVTSPLKTGGSYDDGHYVKTSMTQYKPEEGFSLQITSFNEYGFTINQNIQAVGPVILFPKTIFSWNVEGPEDINERSLSLFKHLEPRVDILIIGTGDGHTKINPEIAKWLIRNKINNFEILRTVKILFIFQNFKIKINNRFKKDKAINAFNFLIGENRFVGAALIPALIRRENDFEAQKHMERLELYKQIEAQDPKSLSDERVAKYLENALNYDKKLSDGKKNN